MKNYFLSAAIVVAALTLALGMQSCKSPIDKTKLGGYWVLTQMNGADAKDEFKGPIPTMEFSFADSIVSGSAGCNRYSGKFKIDEDSKLVAPHMASTMKMCAFANKEDEFIKALSDTPVISFNQNGALTFTKDNKVTLQFVLGEPVDTQVQALTLESLTGKWNLNTLGKEDVKTLFKDSTPYIEFSPEGSVTGNAGCNNYRSKVDLGSDNTLAFGPMISTKMACPNMDAENMYTALFQLPLQAKVNGDVLTFIQNGATVLTFTKNK